MGRINIAWTCTVHVPTCTYWLRNNGDQPAPTAQPAQPAQPATASQRSTGQDEHTYHSIGARDLGKTSKIGRHKKTRGLEINLPHKTPKHTTLASRAGSRSHDVFHHRRDFVENARGLKRRLAGADWLLSASLISGALPRPASSMAISCVIPAVGRVWPFFAYLLPLGGL